MFLKSIGYTYPIHTMAITTMLGCGSSPQRPPTNFQASPSRAANRLGTSSYFGTSLNMFKWFCLYSMDDCILYGQLFIDFRWFFYLPSLEILSLEKDFWLNELVDILVAEVIEDPVDGHDDQEISGDIQPKSEKNTPDMAIQTTDLHTFHSLQCLFDSKGGSKILAVLNPIVFGGTKIPGPIVLVMFPEQICLPSSPGSMS